MHSRLFTCLLVFTNSVRHVHLERIAEADEHEVIKDFQVKEDVKYLILSLFSRKFIVTFIH